jgi:hypothetical protein
VIILSVLSIGVSRILSNDTNTAINYKNIDTAYNSFYTQNYPHTIETTTIDSTQGLIQVTKKTYEKDGILLYKYEL